MFLNLILRKKSLFLLIVLIIIILLFVLTKNSNEVLLVSEPPSNKKTVQVKKINVEEYSRKLIFRGFTEYSRSVTLKSQVD